MHASRALSEKGRNLARLHPDPAWTGPARDRPQGVLPLLELGDRSGSEERPDRKPLIYKRLHSASLGPEPVSDLGNKPPLEASGVKFILRRLTLALAAGDCRGPIGRAADNLVQRHLALVRIGQPHDYEAEMQEVGDARE